MSSRLVREEGDLVDRTAASLSNPLDDENEGLGIDGPGEKKALLPEEINNVVQKVDSLPDSVRTNRHTIEYELLMNKADDEYHLDAPSLSAIVWPFGTRDSKTDHWPRELLMLFHLQFWVGLFLFSAGAITFGLTASGYFNMQMAFTTDFLTIGAYPASEHNIGNIRIGWFIATAFIVYGTALFWLLFWPRYYINHYFRNQLRYRKDEIRSITTAITLALFQIAIYGAVGITNVFLILFATITIVGLYLFWHHNQETAYAAYARVHDDIVPIIHNNDGVVSINTESKMSDSLGHNASGREMNDHMGWAKRSLLDIGRSVAMFYVTARNALEHPVRVPVDFTERQMERFFEVLATHTIISISPRIMNLYVSLWIYIPILVVPIAYFGAAVNNTSDTYHSWAIASIWIFLILQMIDVVISYYYWSHRNHKYVRHSDNDSLSGRKTLMLALNHIWFTYFEWFYWGVSFLAVGFTLLAGGNQFGGSKAGIPLY